MKTENKTKYYSGPDWYLCRLKKLPPVSKRRAIIYIMSLCNNPVVMPTDKAMRIFELARMVKAILEDSNGNWFGNQHWKG